MRYAFVVGYLLLGSAASAEPEPEADPASGSAPSAKDRASGELMTLTFAARQAVANGDCRWFEELRARIRTLDSVYHDHVFATDETLRCNPAALRSLESEAALLVTHTEKPLRPCDQRSHLYFEASLWTGISDEPAVKDDTVSGDHPAASPVAFRNTVGVRIHRCRTDSREGTELRAGALVQVVSGSEALSSFGIGAEAELTWPIRSNSVRLGIQAAVVPDLDPTNGRSIWISGGARLRLRMVTLAFDVARSSGAEQYDDSGALQPVPGVHALMFGLGVTGGPAKVVLVGEAIFGALALALALAMSL